MSLMPPRPSQGSARVSDPADHEYLVSYGKNGAFGRFAASEPLRLLRGDRVVVQSPRGVELGQVLCASTPRHAVLLTHEVVGPLLRAASNDDLTAAARWTELSSVLFEDSRRLTTELALPLEILDGEVLLDGRKAVLQFLAAADADVSPLADALAERHELLVLFENLALPVAQSAPEDENGGCGKPDCGKKEGGGCSTCDTGGGCSSCGAGKVDMTAYFAHLRTQMEKSRRVPLA